MLSILKATAVAFAGLALAPSVVRAHTTADPDEGTAGGYQRTAFRITHGCKGSPTTAVTIRMPDGVILAKPMPKPGWTVEIKTRPLETPVDSGHGFKVREAVTEVTWRACGRLENAQFDELWSCCASPGLAQGKTGETIYFPTVQACEKGENNWTGIPAGRQNWHDLGRASAVREDQAGGGGHAH
jgi:uncharacterized protein YcnI